MVHPHASPSIASSQDARKITRHDLASHLSVSLRTVDELLRRGILPHYKIGKAVRFDLAQVEEALRQRCWTRSTPSHASSASPRPLTH